MGINVVVVARNQYALSLEDFLERLAHDRFGERALSRLESADEWPDDQPVQRGWMAFDWEGQRYFSWLYSPRLRHLDLYQEEAPAPNPDNAMQITFLRIMAAVERITGGPIFVGNDAIDLRYPDPQDRDAFFLPLSLDNQIPDWREACAIEPAEIGLIF